MLCRVSGNGKIPPIKPLFGYADHYAVNIITGRISNEDAFLAVRYCTVHGINVG